MSRILIVEDSKSARMFIKNILNEAGHETMEAENGNVCLKILENEKFDLIIMDIVMPEKEGIETIMISKEKYPELPVIAISGVSLSETYLKSAKRFGADLTLYKPFNKEEILEAIGKIL